MNIIELAKQANGEPAWNGGIEWHWDELQKFAALVAAQEREECAKLCFSIWNNWLDTPEEDRYKVLYDAEDCAAAIRARSNT
jgi:hypothetical protein